MDYKTKGSKLTEIYACPEIIKGHPYTLKRDIWVLGIILFYMISSYHPFYINKLKP
jgi:serine/threonine protein kinase